MAVEYDNPTVIAGVVAGLVAVGIKLLDSAIAKRTTRETSRISDRELLSKDEQEFRQSVIRQLQQCHDAQTQLHEENYKLSRDNLLMSGRINELEFEITSLQTRLKSLDVPNNGQH